jgi:putative phosphoesterase
MTNIGLISDTHGFLDENVFKYFEQCDEIWHAGDFGDISVAEKLNKFKPLRGVYGNIDGNDIRNTYPEKLHWQCERVKVFMTHIGGYPPKYTSAIKKEMIESKPQLFICGHSHILKIMYDAQLQCLHINPGAAGNQGWHKIRTAVRFAIDEKEIKNCEVIEFGKRG